MSKTTDKYVNQRRRANRVRAKVSGTAQRPRMSVSISNLHVSAQIIDDTTSRTLAAATTVSKKAAGTMTEKATWVGAEIAKDAKKHKISKIVFDKGGKKYHGRIKALADSAREEGLNF